MSKLLGKRILIVEDEFLVAEDLRRMIEQAGAVPVGPTLTERAGRILAGREKIDAAVLDVHLSSDATSQGVALALKRRRVPFIIITGYSRDSMPEAMRGEPFMGKPILRDVLLDALEMLVERHPGTAKKQRSTIGH
jgi:DNA-binding NtrC family response regulator